MKILFFTPIVVMSAIGRVSNLVVTALERIGHEVIVVRSEEPDLFETPIHPFTCQTLVWTDEKQIRNVAKQIDLVVYQVGNHYPYHRGCLEWLPLLPGLVSLHDYFMGHLFWSWSEKIGRIEALELLKVLYGSDIANQFFNHHNSESFIAYASEAAPMTEWIVSMASGVITHSSWTMNRIISATHGPVEIVPLPYDAPHLENTQLMQQNSKNKEIVVLTIGYVNPNKRYVSIIKAIGSNIQLREDLTFRIVGSIEPSTQEELQSLAEHLKVKIVITGSVDDQRLADEIINADIMCCLRWPALESASASTIEAMLYGKPTIVTDTGFYSDLPDECVLKISYANEIEDIEAAFNELASSPERRKKIGEDARLYASQTFTADNYAERIVAMKQRIEHTNVIADVAREFSNKLKEWGSEGNSKILEAVAKSLNIFR
jgi:glycosyltransferase involved in cell wall biosynthesis